MLGPELYTLMPLEKMEVSLLFHWLSVPDIIGLSNWLLPSGHMSLPVDAYVCLLF